MFDLHAIPPVLLIPGSIVLFLLARLVTILFHESGHALAALYYTKGPVDIFIGSLGNAAASGKLRRGRVTVYISIRIKGGLCRFEEKGLTAGKRALIVAAGPLVSLSGGVLMLTVILLAAPGGITGYFLAALCAWFYLDLIYSGIPRSKTIKTQGSGVIHNDGMQLLEYFRRKKLVGRHAEVQEMLDREQWQQAAAEMEKMLDAGIRGEPLLWMAAETFYKGKDYEGMERIYLRFRERSDLQLNELIMLGYARSMQGKHGEALQDYEDAVKLEPENHYALNNRGFSLVMLGRFEEAIEDFNCAAADGSPVVAHAYNNRGRARLMLGKMHEALADIRKGIELDETNAYAWQNLGLYHLHAGEPAQALAHFEKAASIDATIPDLQRDLEKARGGVVTEGA